MLLHVDTLRDHVTLTVWTIIASNSQFTPPVTTQLDRLVASYRTMWIGYNAVIDSVGFKHQSYDHPLSTHDLRSDIAFAANAHVP